ncbi:ABC transporter ATP-binding protein [Salsipaludibacter albus]|uniref:ABC transporter ATP-binding protein n=1 Tax=Salsipaludibacter albus TaxID=2849650 RepID=UPI001EE3D9E0|nr:ABC transporter ATP-binding protein [Salsipaludibacter albus]MBY5162232.1 ABC transporter ATP-binding protein/permease [Salsipaludibacter albus]
MIPVRAYLALLTTHLREHRARMALLAVLVLGDIAVQLAIPQVVRTIIDDALAGTATDRLVWLAGMVVLAALAHMGLAVAATRVAEEVGWRATNDLRADLADHVLHLDLGFHKQHPPGELLERVDGDVTALSNFFSAMVVKVVGNGVLIAGIVVLLLRESWLVGVTLGVLVGLGILAMGRLHAIAVPWWRRQRAVAAETFGQLGEQVDGTEDIAGNGGGRYMQERFADQLRTWMPLHVRGWMGWALMWGTSEVLQVLLLVAVFVLGAWQLDVGTMTVGTVYLVLNYAEMVGHPLHEIREQMQDLQKAGASIARVEDLLATPTALPPAGTTPLPTGPLGLSLTGVGFAYHDARPDDGTEPKGDAPRVLHDIDLEVPAGRVLGIVGRTGSGKSTLARLVTRLYDPDTGHVRVGGVETAEAADLRDRVAMVTQDVQLFRATVRDNLTFFDPSIDDARLVEAVATLGLDDWLATLPDGLDTRLGGDGVGVSAGQAQLLAFTRVFLRDPGLVVLDEASSRLDPATEAWLERAVDGLLRDRTGVIIAHRLGTLERVDDVLVMADGRVVEHGPRERLRADRDSRYAHLLATGLEEVLT